MLKRLLVVAAAVAVLAAPSAVQAGSQKDIVDTAVAAGSFKTLATALKAAGLIESLKGSGPITVTDSTGTILITGHYDSHPPAPGAGDDGISVAAMLETMRVLAA